MRRPTEGLKNNYNIMNDTMKRYIVSSVTTFLTAFFGVLAIQLGSGVPLELTWTFVFGVASVAARAGVKAVVESIASKPGDPT